ncbi:MAG: SMI1/KNR4 family protein [Oscillospiraceae bacterium]|nr:SMI1/KNR4 family protein [Oscillospiraceae bacterium]
MKIIINNQNECNISIDDAELLSVDEVKSFFRSMNIDISDDFAEFYSEFNGGCGFPEICGTEDESFTIEDSFYIDVYTPSALKNTYDESEQIIENAFFFATDGGEMEIGYDYVQNKYFWIPSIDIGVEQPEYIGDNTEEFINYLIEYYAE